MSLTEGRYPKIAACDESIGWRVWKYLRIAKQAAAAGQVLKSVSA